MPGLLALPENQQPLHWLHRINNSLSPTSNDFNYLHYLRYWELIKMSIYFYVSYKILAQKGVIPQGWFYRLVASQWETSLSNAHLSLAGCKPRIRPVHVLKGLVTILVLLANHWACMQAINPPLHLLFFLQHTAGTHYFVHFMLICKESKSIEHG